MYKNMLVVLDGTRRSEHVVPWARRLARHGRATIHLLVVRPVVKDVAIRGRTMVYVDQLEAQSAAEAHAALKPVAVRLEEEGFEVATEVRFGEPVATILAAAHNAGVDVIAIATHRPEGVWGLWKRSVAEDLLRRSPVPVFVTRPGDQAAA